jgi:UMF1 family MFS transporter
MSETEPSPLESGRRGIFAWCLFDWANSAFPTVIITFVFAAYFTRAIAETPEVGTAQWGWTMSASALIVALLSPVLGAVADQGGRRKPWLAVTTGACVATSAALWFVAPGPALLVLALVLVAVANAAFEMGQVFYNAILPDIVPPGRLGRISGWAWGLGYAGGLVCLALVYLLFVQPERPLFGLNRESAEQVRIAGPLVALWFLVFALPLFLWTPDRTGSGRPFAMLVRDGLGTLWRTLVNLGRYRNIARFLIARMIYIDGLNTLFLFGGIYAAGTFDMGYDEILVFGIVLNVAAGLGAAGFAWLDDWLGAKPTIVVSVLGLCVFGAAILLIDSKPWFYVYGCLIGTVAGPTQSASRSLMARLAPADMRAEMFGLYALSGRATAFVGPALVGWVTLWSGSQRIGMATTLAFFLVGLALLLPLRAPGGSGLPGSRSR